MTGCRGSIRIPLLSDNLTIASCVGADTSDEPRLADVLGIGTDIVHALANDVVLQNSACCLIYSGNDRIGCSRGANSPSQSVASIGSPLICQRRPRRWHERGPP